MSAADNKQDNKQEKLTRSKPRTPKNDEDYIQRPDRSKFLEQLNEHRRQIEEHRATLAKHNQIIEQEQSGANQTPEETKLREEHSSILSERNRLKDLEKRITSDAQKVEDSVKGKLSELQLLRPKNGPRSAKEIDQQIEKLDRQVESGSLSIAAENRVLKDITSLKKQRASLERADKLQAEIDDVRSKAAEIRKTIDHNALRQVHATKAELEKKLDTFNESRRATRGKLNEAYDGRRQAHGAIKELYGKMDVLRSKFDEDMASFNEKMKAKMEQREAEEAQNQVRQAKQKKIQDAEAKVAAAREPAYGPQIEKAQSLLAYFDPRASPEAEAASSGQSSASTSSNSSASSVSKALNAPTPSGRALQPTAKGAPPSRKSLKQKNKDSNGSSQSLHLDLSIIDALSSLKIALPTSPNQLEATKTQIREKIEFYKENNERVTKERVDRAEEELKKVREEAEAEAKTASSA